MSTPRLVLAFDIERSGATPDFYTLAIGCSVVNEKLEELERLFLPGYLPRLMSFEPRCWEEFWSKHPEQLAALTYKGPLPNLGSNVVPYRQKAMIEAFQAFRAKWEAKAKEMGAAFELITDNNVFDGGFINLMIFNHLPKVMPIPYSASSPQEYSTFFETTSQQRNLLMMVDLTFKPDSLWGLSARIFELYDVPPCPVKHTHLPDEDAFTIAYDQQILHGIHAGIYKLKPTPKT